MTRIAAIQKELKNKDLDAVVLFSESNVRYAGQFAFTDGAVVVTQDSAELLTDSRYVEAAEAEAKDVTVRCVSAEHPRRRSGCPTPAGNPSVKSWAVICFRQTQS